MSAFVIAPLLQNRLAVRPFPLNQNALPRRLPSLPTRQVCPTAQLQGPLGSAKSTNTSTEDTFAINAGRDLFFTEMDDDKAIQLLDAELGSLVSKDDRFIAAERLKFFPSEKAADAIIRFVKKFDPAKMDQYPLEDRVSRRKAIEALGRHKGAFRRQQVEELLSECLRDKDPYMVEVAVWTLAEIGVANDSGILKAVMGVLDNDEVEKRVIIQTLMRASYQPALERIRPLIGSLEGPASSAAMTAVAMLSSDPKAMEPVLTFLKSSDLNVRRAAIEDITVSKYVPAIRQVAACPNSLVLRARTIRILLDVLKEENPEMAQCLDPDMSAFVDRLIWDHPGDLDLLGQKKETRKARDPARNIRQLYKNDALYAYLACKCLAEDHRDSDSSQVGDDAIKSYDDLGYFDYFGAYHVYKTLGWLKHHRAYDMLLDNAENLPPRFFNHQAGAVTALAELGKKEAIPALHRIAENVTIWEVQYACLIACERLGDDGELRSRLKTGEDWLVRARANSALAFGHLRNGFEKED